MAGVNTGSSFVSQLSTLIYHLKAIETSLIEAGKQNRKKESNEFMPSLFASCVELF